MAGRLRVSSSGKLWNPLPSGWLPQLHFLGGRFCFCVVDGVLDRHPVRGWHHHPCSRLVRPGGAPLQRAHTLVVAPAFFFLIRRGRRRPNRTLPRRGGGQGLLRARARVRTHISHTRCTTGEWVGGWVASSLSASSVCDSLLDFFFFSCAVGRVHPLRPPPRRGGGVGGGASLT